MLSTKEGRKAVDGNGNECESTRTTDGNANGASGGAPATAVQPQVPATITMKKRTTTQPASPRPR
jgi:hypothetical protein